MIYKQQKTQRSTNNRQHNDLQTTTQKTKDLATLTSLKPWDDIILNNDNCQPTRQQNIEIILVHRVYFKKVQEIKEI